MRLGKSPVARLPWITLTVVSAALAVAVIPGAGELLQYARAAVESGEYWRLLSSQLAHWTPRMATADLLVLLITGAWLESRSRRLVSWTFLATGLLVGVAVHAWLPELSLYRGSSGIASGLFVAVALDIFGSPSRSWLRYLALASLLLFGAKTAWEAATGAALLAGPLPPGVLVTPTVHLVGALAGILCSVVVPRREARSGRDRGGLSVRTASDSP
jgi:rhomboid family GlyGly-CTERM serine protease